MITNGQFYSTITASRGDSIALKKCMEDSVTQLLKKDTSIDNPGMLLGKIQSGKTRAFIGIIALSFDNDYDIAIVLTKGTKVLAQQTYERLKKDFEKFTDDNDEIQIFDVLHVPENLPKYVLKQKLILVVKKETNNLIRITKALMETYPDLGKKKLLIIDDEADFASIGFRSDSDGKNVEMNTIASQIDNLRKQVLQADYLQVTATPYSLYLQPEEYKNDTGDIIFKPIRPAFTVLLPIFDGYVGGDFYFKDSEAKNSIASYIYESINMAELPSLKQQDRRSFKVEEALTSDKILMLRKGIMNFIVGACIRRLQQQHAGEKQRKYCFVVHTEQGKQSHSWQEQIVITIKELLIKCIDTNSSLFSELIKASYDDLLQSIQLISNHVPTYQKVLEQAMEYIKNDYFMINTVNSDKEMQQLLDSKGQLKLSTPLNIYIGGQILDRGITIDNLIGFYYGRRPQRFQQDTVLQHSRMFGNRKIEDLAVTRFYTAQSIHEIMNRINEFDTGLREEFEKGGQEAGIVFIYKDQNNQIVPCSPNKILLSTTTTLKPYKRMLPYGFQTDYKTKIKDKLDIIDKLIQELTKHVDDGKPFLMDLSVAESIIDYIYSMLIFEDGYEWDVKAFKASLEFLSKNSNNLNNRGKLWCLVRTNRNASRFKTTGHGEYFDAPDTAKTEGEIARKIAIDIPILMLFRQNGDKEQNWRDSPFWWPVLYAPRETRTCVFTSELLKPN
ncbi:MAG: hypothetical protein A9183_03710 [Dehalococcoides mccartyi]|uniref:Z1 domain-containing protein n=1 Tax=Dehalococcoides mccartyi TaxID=61435 RepID=UPI0008047A6D|nr:Z1 domain-containing protein [Dehalococcoides mccartyi]OBW61220.1 MAG: hypothetical protein A9183_03710 [Dehalococcoides mccartyi]